MQHVSGRKCAGDAKDQRYHPKVCVAMGDKQLSLEFERVYFCASSKLGKLFS